MTAQTRISADAPSLLRRSALWNLDAPRLYEEILRRDEGALTEDGALVVETTPHTGRSPADKYIVCDTMTEDTVWWGNNQSMSPYHFARLYADMEAHAQTLRLYAQDLHACADPQQRLNVRVYSELAWHSLFIRNLLIRPQAAVAGSPHLTIIDLPSFSADPERHGCRSQTVIALDLSRGVALICGTRYGGEIKKTVFTFLNFSLPAKGVLPMHCAANDHTDGSAVFFGLSGTGKTTLSADPDRALIGDDEHGWDESGLFNFEGGCYAKAIALSPEHEPEIHAASRRFGVVMENVGMNAVTRRVDFADATKTENTRIAFPLDFIPTASRANRAGHPRNVILLTCDAFGVLPPIAKLDSAQALYHFLSGYTARVAGTERGAKEPQAVFSTCFGAPFMPRPPGEYGEMLRERLLAHKTNCWLVNTGWTGGTYGEGQRMPISLSRALLRAALDGSLDHVEFRRDTRFGFMVPLSAPGVDTTFLDPATSWRSRTAFNETEKKLSEMFQANFTTLAPYASKDVRAAGPIV